MTELVRGMGLFLIWRHKLFCMHVHKELMSCKWVCDIKSGIEPGPCPANSVVNQLMRNKFYFSYFLSIFNPKKNQILIKLSNSLCECCTVSSWPKKHLGVRCTLTGQRHDRVQTESQIATVDSCFDLVWSLQHSVASSELFSWSTDIHNPTICIWFSPQMKLKSKSLPIDQCHMQNVWQGTIGKIQNIMLLPR